MDSNIKVTKYLDATSIKVGLKRVTVCIADDDNIQIDIRGFSKKPIKNNILEKKLRNNLRAIVFNLDNQTAGALFLALQNRLDITLKTNKI